MTASDVLLVATIAWFVPALPAAIGFARLDRWSSAPLAFALGPMAYVGLGLCRRHHDAAMAASVTRCLRV